LDDDNLPRFLDNDNPSEAELEDADILCCFLDGGSSEADLDFRIG
jgi:hypothetical protein